jgi:hypothetical protein
VRHTAALAPTLEAPAQQAHTCRKRLSTAGKTGRQGEGSRKIGLRARELKGERGEEKTSMSTSSAGKEGPCCIARLHSWGAGRSDIRRVIVEKSRGMCGMCAFVLLMKTGRGSHAAGRHSHLKTSQRLGVGCKGKAKCEMRKDSCFDRQGAHVHTLARSLASVCIVHGISIIHAWPSAFLWPACCCYKGSQLPPGLLGRCRLWLGGGRAAIEVSFGWQPLPGLSALSWRPPCASAEGWG